MIKKTAIQSGGEKEPPAPPEQQPKGTRLGLKGNDLGANVFCQCVRLLEGICSAPKYTELCNTSGLSIFPHSILWQLRIDQHQTDS